MQIGSNRKTALLIGALALLLAFSESLARNAEISAITYNAAVGDLWGFFEAKTIRSTVVATAAEQALWEADRTTDAETKAKLLKANDNMKKVASALNDDPQNKEGSKQIADRAVETEGKRGIALARYHRYGLASATFQVGIVLAFAEVITGIAAMGWLSGLVGIFGIAFMALGWLAPQALHLS